MHSAPPVSSFTLYLRDECFLSGQPFRGKVRQSPSGRKRRFAHMLTARRLYWPKKTDLRSKKSQALADARDRAGASPQRRASYGLVGFMPEKSSFVSLVIASGADGCCLKSKQLSMSFAARSRSVKAGKPNRVSISFRGEVKSNWV